MRIFRLCIPFLPKTSSDFAFELSKILLPMIAKPSGRISVSGLACLRDSRWKLIVIDFTDT